MLTTNDILTIAGVIVGMVVLMIVVRGRRRQHHAFLDDRVEEEVCEHLRPAWDLLRARGAGIANAGQRRPELPFEIHLTAQFDPQAIYDEAKLAEPAFVSERKVLYCKEDWVEIHPAK